MNGYQCRECGATDWHTCTPKGSFVQRYAVLLGTLPAVVTFLALVLSVAVAKGAL